MEVISIIMLICGAICLVIGLLLSGSGSTSGLGAIAGQDLELFKKTKDRGMIKILQMIMFILMIVLIVCGVILLVVSK